MLANYKKDIDKCNIPTYNCNIPTRKEDKNYYAGSFTEKC